MIMAVLNMMVVVFITLIVVLIHRRLSTIRRAGIAWSAGRVEPKEPVQLQYFDQCVFYCEEAGDRGVDKQDAVGDVRPGRGHRHRRQDMWFSTLDTHTLSSL